MSQPLADTAIEITADTEPFDDDLDKLGRRTRRRKIKAPVEADTAAMLRQIDRALGGLRGNVDLDPDTAALLRQLDRALDGFNGDVNLDADITRLVRQVDAALAGLKVDVPVRPRLGPQRDARGRFVKLGERLGDDAGGALERVFGKRLAETLRNVGAAVGRIAGPLAKGFGLATAGGVALVSTLQTLVGLAAVFAPIAAAAGAALPGAFLAGAAALAVVHAAVIGVGDALSAAASGDAAKFAESLKGLAPAAREFAVAARDVLTSLRPMQQAMQDTFFAGLGPLVRNVGAAVRSLDDDANSVALGFGRAAAEVLRFAGSSTAVGAMRSALVGVRDFLAQITPSIRPLLDAFAGLAEQSGAFGGTLGGVVAGALGRLADAVSRVDLAALFAAALPIMRTLGDLMSNVGSIFSDVFYAAGASGGGLLTTLVAVTGAVADFLASTDGMAALQGVFTALSSVGSALGTALGAVLPALGQAIVALAPALGPLADVLAQVIVAAAPLLPVIGQLAGVLGGALVAAIGPLVPLVSSLATLLSGSLGALAPVLADVGATIGAILAPAAGLLAALFTQLAPVIVDLGRTIGTLLGPLLARLGPLFVTVISALMPMIPALVSILPPIVEIVAALLPLIEIWASLITLAVQLVAPLLQVAAALVGFLAAEAIAPLLGLIADALVWLLTPLTGVAEWLDKVSTAIAGIDWAGVGSAISGAFAAAWQAVLTFFAGLGQWFTSLPGQIGAALAALPGLLWTIFTGALQHALMAVGIGIGLIIFSITQLPGLALSALGSLAGVIAGALGRAFDVGYAAVQAGVGAILAYLFGIPDRVAASWSRLTGVVSSTWQRALAAGRAAVRAGVDAIVFLIRDAPNRIAALAGRFAAAGSRLIGQLVAGLKRVPSLGSIASSIAGVIKSQLNRVIGSINSGIASVDAKLPGSLPRIPHLARGAIVDKPTLAVVGEEAREVVIPLTRPDRARQLAAESGLDRILTGGAGRSPIAVSLRAYIGSREITDIVRIEVDEQLDEQAAQLNAGPRVF